MISSRSKLTVTVSALALSLVASSCETGQYGKNDPNRFGAGTLPVINTTPTIATDGTEMFSNNPLVEFQTTGANPAPARTLYSGQKLTVLRQDGAFSQIQLDDGTVGFVNTESIVNNGYSSGRSSSGFQGTTDGNRFGSTTPATPYPSTGSPTPPLGGGISPTAQPEVPSGDSDMIDLDNL